MALLVMAVWDTEENGRTQYTSMTLASLFETVDWSRHRLVVVDNGSCDATADLLAMFDLNLISLPANIGQARALNRGLLLREPGELIVRLDNDIAIKQRNWIEDMEYVLEKDPHVGVVSLKRTNAWESPTHPSADFRSRLEMLQHNEGDRWMVIEVAKSVLGTCQGMRPEFLDEIGFLYQVGSLWGFIDPIVCAKAQALGYKTVYIPHVRTDYLDNNIDKTPYLLWKRQCASEFFPKFEEEKERILASGSVYNGPEDL